MAFIQGNSGSTGGTVTPNLSVGFGSANTLNNLLIGITREPFSSGLNTQITDTQGNTWTKKLTFSNGFDQMELFYASKCKAGANTAHLTLVGGGSTFMRLVIGEYSDTTQVGDMTNFATGSSATPNSGSIIPSAARALLIGFPANTSSDSITFIAAGWNVRNNADSNLYLCDREVTIAGSYSFSGTYGLSEPWGAGIVDFVFSLPGVANSLMMVGLGI